MSKSEEKHGTKIQQKMESPTQGNKTTNNRTKKNKKRNGGESMSWHAMCIEDPSDAENEDEYMFDEYIDMMIDRARGQD